MCHQCVTISPRSSDTKTDRVFVAGDRVYLDVLAASACRVWCKKWSAEK